MTRLEWSFDPFVTVPLAITGALYATGVVRLWARAGIWQSVKRWQAACFAAGWLSLFAALVTPLHELGEHLFTAYMIEHEILMAIAAPLLALSRPWRIPLRTSKSLATLAQPRCRRALDFGSMALADRAAQRHYPARGRNLDMARASPVRCHYRK
jgi:cytochrome c oxidase assembly factor CtaG